MPVIQNQSSGGNVLYVNADFAPSLAAAGLDTVEAFLTAGELVRRKDGKENVRLLLEASPGRPTLYLKRHFATDARPGLDEWENAFRVASTGVATARPVAAGANERGSFFVSEGIPGGRPLDEALAAGLPSRRGRGALIRLLAGMAAALHGHNLFHRDFYLCHVFVVGWEEEAFELKLIDLQRVLSPRLLRRRWMVKDLASLHYSCAREWATAADRARFLSLYLDRLGAGPLRRDRRFARAVLRKAARIARHNRPREA